MFKYIEIFDNIAGAGCDLDDWNSVYDGCKCNVHVASESNETNLTLPQTDLINNTNIQEEEFQINKNYEYKENNTNYARSNSDLTQLNLNEFKICKNINKNKNNNNSNICYKNSVANCTCIIDNRNNYSSSGKLDFNFEEDKNWFEKIYPINECSLECDCDEAKCLNRVVQNGCQFNLEILESGPKGKGLRTLEKIPIGSFVIEYMGEVIGREQAEELIKCRNGQDEPNYILFLRELFTKNSKIENDIKLTIIDAKNYSNQARFINHSCEPNLFVLPVRINNIVPHAALFALRDINEMEELSYDYNGTVGDGAFQKMVELSYDEKKNVKLTKCFCGSIKCKGYLPTNAV